MLRKYLLKTWPVTMASALAGFCGTLLTVRLIGLESYASYGIDLAKLSVVLLLTEAVPASFSIFRQQEDNRFKDALPAYFLSCVLLTLPLIYALSATGYFSAFSAWVYIYAAAVVVQRYLDAQSQADGKAQVFFLIPLITNLVRAIVLYTLLFFPAHVQPEDAAWGGLALGSVIALIAAFVRNPAYLKPCGVKQARQSLLYLWHLRSEYYGYYLNSLLKRCRDVQMPLICDWYVSDRSEIGRYLLVCRAVEFACGQLRVIEAFLGNVGLRAELAGNRLQGLLVAACIAQVGAVLAALVLISQAELASSSLTLALVASLIVYPYTFEIGARSDAYAIYAPIRVTYALGAFVIGVIATVGVLSLTVGLTATTLVFAPIIGQSLAALTYPLFFSHRNVRLVRNKGIKRKNPHTMKTNSNKKLVYILNYASADDTQHYVHVFNLLEKLQLRGWSIVLLSEKGGVGVQKVFGQEVRYMSRDGNWTRVLQLAKTLLSLRRAGYKLVFVRISKPAALTAAILGAFAGWKTLYWLSGTNQDLDQGQQLFRRVLNNALTGAIYRFIDYFVTGPETMVAYFRTTLRIPDEKMMLLYNDIELSAYRAKNMGFGRDSGAKQILFVHSLSPSKEATRYFPALVATLSKIAPDVGGINLRLIGEGKERAQLEAAAVAAGPGLGIHFLGSVPNRTVREYYSAADIFIMPSYREGMPRVILEAMAMGLPIVTTDAGGTRDLLGPLQQAFVVSRDDPRAFANKVASLVGDIDTQRLLARENRKFVQRFSTESVATMYDAKLSALLLRTAPRA
ncbi:MAG: glycosyltransferase family 4 protein [Betaproteobacteria bacterium]|nr:glycosyltransferase family 4 protein [Betaproteobacteria bacterium]